MVLIFVLKNLPPRDFSIMTLVSTQSSQGKVKSMKTKSAVPEKTIKVPSTSMYKDNKIYKCPVCKGSLISEDAFDMWSHPQRIEQNLQFFDLKSHIKYAPIILVLKAWFSNCYHEKIE